MTVFLDIDHVLLSWKHGGKHTGFDDWALPERRVPYFSVYSKKQLALIAELFQVEWLTTWNEMDDRRSLTAGPFPMVDSLFTPETRFGPYPRVPDAVKGVLGFWDAQADNDASNYRNLNPYSDPIKLKFEDPELLLFLDRVDWFKMNAIAARAVQGTLPDKFLWVDDELDFMNREGQIDDVLSYLDLTDRVWRHAPVDGWSKTMIEEGHNWLTGK